MWTPNDEPLKDEPRKRTRIIDAGAVNADQRLEMIAAMEAAHTFPGHYRVVVIAPAGEEFRLSLLALVRTLQAEDLTDADDSGASSEVVDSLFRLEERSSREGNYVSYHLDIYVTSAEIALQRKDRISALEGVSFLL
jgi:putative lipoic acid-binding regulatory protein